MSLPKGEAFMVRLRVDFPIHTVLIFDSQGQFSLVQSVCVNLQRSCVRSRTRGSSRAVRNGGLYGYTLCSDIDPFVTLQVS